MNMLFLNESDCLRGMTVLMLTHEFNSVIDSVHVLSRNFNPTVKASFLENKIGILIEKKITKDDIKSYHEIANHNIKNLNNKINKLVYTRRLGNSRAKRGCLEFAIKSV